MKRTICLILALVMCIALLSCGEKAVQEETPDTPADDDTVQGEVNTKDEDITDEEPPVDPKTVWNGSFTRGGEGYYDPERDYSKEERFKVCAFAQEMYIFSDQLDAALEAWFTLANVEYDGIIESKGLDIATEVEQIAKEYDGVILLNTLRYETMVIARILEENNCSFISYGDLRDYSLEEQPLLCPTVHYTIGFSPLVSGVAEYIESELKNVPDEKIGIIYGNESYYFPTLEQQFLDEVALQIPEYVDNCYLLDFYSATIDYLHYEGFFENMIDEHPGVEYWIYVPLETNYYNKYRDAEAEFARHPRFEGKAAIFSMNSPYDVWVTDECTLFEKVYSCDYVFQMEPLAFGLCALIRGEATPETLWVEYKTDGEKYAIYPDDTCHEITKDNYKDYFAKVNEYLGAEYYVFDSGEETASEPVDAPPEAPDYRYEFWNVENYPEYGHFYYEDIADREVYTTVPSDLSRAPTRYNRVTSLSESSPVIVHGEIIDVRYIDNNNSTFLNLAYTIYDIEITECIHGEYEVGDIVSVFEYGGYIRAETYNGGYGQNYDFGDTVLKPKLEENEIVVVMPFADAPTLEIGDECVMFLSENQNIYHYDHSWKITGAFTGRFVVDDNGMVSRWSEEGTWEEWGTLDELLEIARNTSFNENAVITRDLYCP